MIPYTIKNTHGSSVTLYRSTVNTDLTVMLASLMTIRKSSPTRLMDAVNAFDSGDKPNESGFKIMRRELANGKHSALGHISFTFIIEGPTLLTAMEIYKTAQHCGGHMTIQIPSAQYIDVNIRGLKTDGINPLVGNDTRKIMRTLEKEFAFIKSQYKDTDDSDQRTLLLAPFKIKCNILLTLNGWSRRIFIIVQETSQTPEHITISRAIVSLIERSAPETFADEKEDNS